MTTDPVAAVPAVEGLTVCICPVISTLAEGEHTIECAVIQRKVERIVAERVTTANAEVLRDGSLDLTIGSAGENGEPDDRQVRNLAATGYLVVTCEALDIAFDPDEADDFTFARAIYRRVRAALGDGR